MDLLFTVDGAAQTIKETDHCNPVDDSREFLYAIYTITGMAGMTCTPVFWHNG